MIINNTIRNWLGLNCKYHWFLFTFSNGSQTNSIVYGFEKCYVNKSNRDLVLSLCTITNAIPLSISYLGYATKEEFDK